MGLTIDVNSLGKTFGVSGTAIQAAIELLDAGNTVPFIARYRKEQTGGLDEEQLRRLADEVAAKRALEERRAEILSLLERQGNLSQELEKLILAAETLQQLEDLYRPYRPKRRTRASTARERGLEPLADWLQAGIQAIHKWKRRNTSAMKSPILRAHCKVRVTSWLNASVMIRTLENKCAN